jgi:hypothetical protein
MATRQKPNRPQPTAKRGVVARWFEPDGTRPGKMILDDDTQIAWWPDRDTDELEALAEIDIDNIVGQTVLITMRRTGEYQGQTQYTGVTIEVESNGEATPPSKKAEQGAVSKPAPSSDPSIREDRIMLQNAMGHVALAYGDWNRLDPETRGTFSDYLKAIAMGATWVLKSVYQTVGYAPQRPVEAPEPNVEPEPDVDYPDEDDTASNMGVFEA